MKYFRNKLLKREIEFVSWNNFQEKSNWHESQEFFGKAIAISKESLIASIIFICLITPFTNWLIPFLPKIIKTGITIRY